MVIAYVPFLRHYEPPKKPKGDEPVFALVNLENGNSVWVSSFNIKDIKQIDKLKWTIELNNGEKLECITEEFNSPLPFRFNP